jgi:diguanylate cyclase (GGDEF)-like protein
MSSLAQIAARLESHAKAALPAASPPIRVLTVGRSDRCTLALQMVRIGGLVVDHRQVRRVSDALPHLRAGATDVGLLDLEQGGAAAMRGLRELCAAAPQVPFIVLAGMEQESAAVAAVCAGAQDYLIGEHLTPASAARAVRCAVERHRQLAALRDQSLRDPLTGLYNRRGFVALADVQLRMARRERRHCLVICADLDRLKSVNDTWGHEAGDRAVVATSGVLQASFRDSDIVARFGGDEFVALAYHAGEESVAGVTARIESGLTDAQDALHLPHPLRLSMGVVAFDPAEKLELRTILEQADRALYRQKQSRRAAAATATPRRAARRSGAGAPGHISAVG